MNYANTSKNYNPAIYIWLLTITAMVLLIISINKGNELIIIIPLVLKEAFIMV